MSFDWYARIVSDEYAKLKTIVGKINAKSLSVVQIEEEVFIKSNKFDALDSPAKVFSSAEDMLKAFHGLLLVNELLPKISVRINGVVDRNSNHYYIFAKDYINLSGSITVRNKSDLHLPEMDPTRWAELIMNDNNVKNAFEYVRLGLNEPFVMYDIYEIIREDVNKEFKKIDTKYTRRLIGLFTGTLNDPRILGERARHAIPQGGDTMSNPLTIEQCRSFIDELISDWIKYKLTLYNI